MTALKNIGHTKLVKTPHTKEENTNQHKSKMLEGLGII